MVDFTDLFGKIGKLSHLADVLNASRGTTVPGLVAALATAYADDLPTIDGVFSDLASYQRSPASFLSRLGRIASATLIGEVNDDVTLPDRRLGTAMAQLVAQMQGASQSVKACAVSSSVTPGAANSGSCVWVVSLQGGDGLTLENAFAETITATCAADSQSGGAAAGSERFTLRGFPSAPDRLSYAYPAGSGVTAPATCVDASADGPGGSLQSLRNGDFEAFSVANTPDHFNIRVGTAGTTVLQSGTAYTGSSALALVGDGATAVAVDQEFGTDNGNSLRPTTAYSWNLWCRTTTATPASGVLEIALVDGTGAITADSQGTPNSATVDLTSLGTSYVPRSGTFRTPRVLPTTLRLRVRTSTPLPAGCSALVDRLAFARMARFYAGGPLLTPFSSGSLLIAGDTFAIAVANDYAGLLQRAWDRFFNMKGLGLLLPSTSDSPSLPDSLIS